MRRHTTFRNYSRHDCSDDCSNDIVIPMSGSYCRYYNRHNCSDDCSNDIVIPMSGSYCRYYSRHAIVVMTVAMENRMPTHAIFFLIYAYLMSDTIYKKKSRPSKQQRRRCEGPRSTPWHKRAASQKQR